MESKMDISMEAEFTNDLTSIEMRLPFHLGRGDSLLFLEIKLQQQAVGTFNFVNRSIPKYNVI